MAVEPTGFIALHLDGLRTLVADCEAFQSWVGGEDAGEAKASVYIEAFYTNDNLPVHRPFCLIGLVTSESEEVATRRLFTTSGGYRLIFEANVDPEHAASQEDAGFAFRNAVDAIIAEIKTKSDGEDEEGNSYVRISRLALEDPMRRTDPLRGQVDGDAFSESWTVMLGGWQ